MKVIYWEDYKDVSMVLVKGILLENWNINRRYGLDSPFWADKTNLFPDQPDILLRGATFISSDEYDN